MMPYAKVLKSLVERDLPPASSNRCDATTHTHLAATVATPSKNVTFYELDKLKKTTSNSNQQEEQLGEQTAEAQHQRLSSSSSSIAETSSSASASSFKPNKKQRRGQKRVMTVLGLTSTPEVEVLEQQVKADPPKQQVDSTKVGYRSELMPSINSPKGRALVPGGMQGGSIIGA
ncbi:unnamed protein product [Amoebophrya sp. A25]|nr:unnamed protein product [Amoebophrya sp. A25]|eukprot:GSA25T00004601001.1